MKVISVKELENKDVVSFDLLYEERKDLFLYGIKLLIKKANCKKLEPEEVWDMDKPLTIEIPTEIETQISNFALTELVVEACKIAYPTSAQVCTSKKKTKKKTKGKNIDKD